MPLSSWGGMSSNPPMKFSDENRVLPRILEFPKRLENPPIKNLGEIKVQSSSTEDQDYFQRKRKRVQEIKTDVTKMCQKLRLMNSPDEYEEEETGNDTYDNNQKNIEYPIS
jgi:DNA-binding ferritin-like protein